MEPLINSKPIIWGSHDLTPDYQSRWGIGAANIWLKQVATELWVCTEYDSDRSQLNRNENDAPPDSVWTRWALTEARTQVNLQPVLPDRSVVLKPEFPFRIIKKTAALIYVRLPVWVRISINAPQPLTLIDIPTIILSNTWFGTMTEGELCYWLITGARRQIDQPLLRPHQAICPVHIVNEADEELVVEKICLRVNKLSLFEFDGQLWSDTTKVTFRGPQNISDVEVSGQPPLPAKTAKLITAPHDPQKRHFSARTFINKLEEISGIDFRI